MKTNTKEKKNETELLTGKLSKVKKDADEKQDAYVKKRRICNSKVLNH